MENAAVSAKLQTVIEELREQVANLPSDRDGLRRAAIAIERLANVIFFQIQKDVIEELRSDRAMPEHGFTGGLSASTPRQPFTVDDL